MTPEEFAPHFSALALPPPPPALEPMHGIGSRSALPKFKTQPLLRWMIEALPTGNIIPTPLDRTLLRAATGLTHNQVRGF